MLKKFLLSIAVFLSFVLLSSAYASKTTTDTASFTKQVSNCRAYIDGMTFPAVVVDTRRSFIVFVDGREYSSPALVNGSGDLVSSAESDKFKITSEGYTVSTPDGVFDIRKCQLS